MELCPKGDSQAQMAGKRVSMGILGTDMSGENKPATLNGKKQLKLTSSQKAQSHMMVAKALLS